METAMDWAAPRHKAVGAVKEASGVVVNVVVTEDAVELAQLVVLL